MHSSQGRSRFILRQEDVGYSPENHGGTTNYRIIGKDGVGAQHLELSIGEIEPGGFAEYHAHPVEQVVHVLEGKMQGFIDGEAVSLNAGDWLFIPSGIFHGVKATTYVKLVVIYSPPLTDHQDEVEVKEMPTLAGEN